MSVHSTAQEEPYGQNGAAHEKASAADGEAARAQRHGQWQERRHGQRNEWPAQTAAWLVARAAATAAARALHGAQRGGLAGELGGGEETAVGGAPQSARAHEHTIHARWAGFTVTGSTCAMGRSRSERCHGMRFEGSSGGRAPWTSSRSGRRPEHPAECRTPCPQHCRGQRAPALGHEG